MKKNNTHYWNNFYKKHIINKETSFARFVINNINKNHNLLDIGCGNGRDTFFFYENNIKCDGIDKSTTVISNNKKIKKDIFKRIDFCKKKINFTKKYDIIYARFLIHAINLNGEKNFFRNVKKVSKKKSKIFLEFRTIKDPMMKKGEKMSTYERYYGHYRRFINPIEFRNKLIKNNFKIIFLKESKNFAIYKNQKPSICRIIAKIK